MPWRIAHRIECHWLQEIVIASALPKEMPVEVAVSVRMSASFLRKFRRETYRMVAQTITPV
jgi:hypothetical protein